MSLSLLTASNNATSTLASAISNVSLTCTLSAGSGALFPTLSANQYFLMTFVDAATGTLREIVQVTARSGDTCTIVRAQEGTTALSWNADDLAVNMITAGTILAMSQAAQVQGNSYNFAIGTGSANSYIATVSPLVTPAADGLVITFKSPATNTGPSTLTFNGLTSVPIVSQGNLALQGGEIVANGLVTVAYNSTYSAWQIIESTGGALAIAPATATHQAAQYGQLTGIVGDCRNLQLNMSTASASATFTADEIILESSIGGVQYKLSNFSKVINISTVGAGGMDVTLSATAYVAIYAIYNPTTGTSALLGYNATSVVASNVYPGANMPAGYTASALISVWLANSGLLTTGYQTDRECFPANLLIFSGAIGTTTPAVTTYPTGAFPQNAKTVTGYVTVTAAASQTAELWLLTKPVLSQGIRFAVNASSISAGGIGLAWGFSSVPISTPGTLYYSAFGSTATSFPVGVNLTGYTI